MTKDQAQEIADRSGASLITVMHRLLGWPVRGKVGIRVDNMLRGLRVPVPGGAGPVREGVAYDMTRGRADKAKP